MIPLTGVFLEMEVFMLLSPQIPVQMTEQVTLDLVTVIELAP